MVLCYELHGNIDEALTRVEEVDQVVAMIGGEGLEKLHPFQKKLDAKREALESAKLEAANSERNCLTKELVDSPAEDERLSLPTSSIPKLPSPVLRHLLVRVPHGEKCQQSSLQYGMSRPAQEQAESFLRTNAKRQQAPWRN